jgi:hypothetical protein
MCNQTTTPSTVFSQVQAFHQATPQGHPLCIKLTSPATLAGVSNSKTSLTVVNRLALEMLKNGQ